MSEGNSASIGKQERDEIKKGLSNRAIILSITLILISVACVVLLWDRYLHCDPQSPRIVQFDCVFERRQKTPRLELPDVHQLTNDYYYYKSPVWSPDGKTIAVMRNAENLPPSGPDPNAWEIVFMDPVTGKMTEFDDPGLKDQVALYPSWSVETGELAFITQVPDPTDDLPWLTKNMLSLYSPDEDELVGQFECGTCEWPAWLSKSTVLVNMNLGNKVFGIAFLDLQTGQFTELIRTDLVGPYAASPDGNEVLMVDDQCTGIWKYTWGSENVIGFIDSSEMHECDPSWSWNGQNLVYIEKHPAIGAPTYLTISNTDGSDPLRLLEPELALYQIRYPAWSPDGTQIVFTYGSEGASTVYIMDIPEHLRP